MLSNFFGVKSPIFKNFKQNQREKHIIYLTSSSIHQKLAYCNRVNIGRSRLIAALKRFKTISYAYMLLSEGTKYYFWVVSLACIDAATVYMCNLELLN